MITEDYVPFETAKLLKEKGFRCNTLHYYYNEDGKLLFSVWTDADENEFEAPTLQMALKWLREVHNIAVNIGWGEIFEETYRWWCIVLNTKNGEILRDSSYHQTYEDAANAAILYILENLM